MNVAVDMHLICSIFKVAVLFDEIEHKLELIFGVDRFSSSDIEQVL